MKEIIDKLDSIKIEHFCSEKNIVERMRKQATSLGENINRTHIW